MGSESLPLKIFTLHSSTFFSWKEWLVYQSITYSFFIAVIWLGSICSLLYLQEVFFFPFQNWIDFSSRANFEVKISYTFIGFWKIRVIAIPGTPTYTNKSSEVDLILTVQCTRRNVQTKLRNLLAISAALCRQKFHLMFPSCFRN